MGSLIPELVSLVAGVVSGVIFERRATIRERKQSEDLQRQVSVLKTSVLSLGGTPQEGEQERAPQDLAAEVTRRALAIQDASGKVRRRSLKAHFVERGNAGQDVDAALASLCEAGIATEDGQWLQMS